MSLVTTAGLAGLFAVSGGSKSSATIVSAEAASATTGSTVVDGGVFGNKWGDVQVEATFAGDGRLVDVVTLRSPDDRGKSVQINDRAIPRLTTEALTVQTADVHTVSGATYTSDGYRRSLQSAIDAARSAGVTTLA